MKNRTYQPRNLNDETSFPLRNLLDIHDSNFGQLWDFLLEVKIELISIDFTEWYREMQEAGENITLEMETKAKQELIDWYKKNNANVVSEIMSQLIIDEGERRKQKEKKNDNLERKRKRTEISKKK
jgi:hypothetical protein